MARHQTHSLDLKSQIAQENLADDIGLLGHPELGLECQIDSISIEPSFLFIEGWLRSNASNFEASSVSLGIAEHEPRTVLSRLFERRDLAALCTSDRIVRAFAAAVVWREVSALPSGFDLRVGAAHTTVPLDPARITPFQPRGYIDEADPAGVVGWLFDPRHETGAVSASLVIDGAIKIALACNEDRDDVPFQSLDARHRLGFNLPIVLLATLARATDPAFAPFDGMPRQLVLMSGGEEISRTNLVLPPERLGHVDHLAGDQISGWGVNPCARDEPALIEIDIDGTRYNSVVANRDRPDLERAAITRVGGGFRACLPPYLAEDAGMRTVTARLAFNPTAFDSKLTPLPPPHAPRGTGRLRLWSNRPSDRRVSVVVAVHNAADALAACLAAVTRHTTAPARLIIIDDASTDPAIEDVLRPYRDCIGIELHRNDSTLGYTITVNKALSLAGHDDVVLLNSDTVVTPGWLDGLRLAQASAPRVGTVTPLSDNAGAFSVPEPGLANHFPAALNTAQIGELVRQASLCLYPEVPTGNGFCLFITRECLDAVGDFDAAAFPQGYGEENDFCMRAGRAGFANIIDDRGFVAHVRSASFGARRHSLEEAGRRVIDERYPDYGVRIRVFQDDHDILTLRWRVRAAAIAARHAGLIPRPRILFVIATETGGTPQTNRDLMRALSTHREPWLLRSDGASMTLSRVDPDGDVTIERRLLRRSIAVSDHASTEYDAILADILVRYAFTIVHVRHLAWHSLGLIPTCARMRIPAILSFHDFYSICPTVKLLDERMRFCGGVCTQSEGDCTADLWPHDSVPPLKHRFIHCWQSQMFAAIVAADAYVTTSPGARDLITRTYRFLAGRDFRVIPHGRNFPDMARLAFPLRAGEPLRVLVPGNISAAKGALLIEATSSLLLSNGGGIEFHVLGNSGTLPARENLILHGRYEREAFCDHVREIAPHIGAILSVWPETWSHTLTELWACGLPVLAIDLGAVGERLSQHGAGWLLAPDADPATVFARLEALRAAPEEIAAKVETVHAWQEGEGIRLDVAAMAARYEALYGEVTERRLAFGAATR